MPPSIDRLRELFLYDESAGVFRWRSKPGPHAWKAVIGAIAGSEDRRYATLCVDGKSLLAHRAAWAYVNGEWPPGQIDHIDGNKKNNSIANLRNATALVNQQNQRRPHRCNSTGFLGVVPVRNKFRAQISIDGASRNKGTYLTAEAAHEAYLKAKREYHEGCTL